MILSHISLLFLWRGSVGHLSNPEDGGPPLVPRPQLGDILLYLHPNEDTSAAVRSLHYFQFNFLFVLTFQFQIITEAGGKTPTKMKKE
jgi:hypothetical protein